MRYILFPDIKNPTHTKDADGSKIKAIVVSDTASVASPYPVVNDLTGYTVVPNDKLTTSKAAKAKRINKEYQTSLEAGAIVGGIKYAITDADRSALAEGLLVINTALITSQNQQQLLATPVSQVFGRMVSDYDGDSHDLTVAEYMQMAMGLAQAVGALQSARNNRLALVEEVFSEQGLSAI